MPVYIQRTVFSYDTQSKKQVVDVRYMGSDNKFYPTAENILAITNVSDAIATVRSLRYKDPKSVYTVEDEIRIEQ